MVSTRLALKSSTDSERPVRAVQSVEDFSANLVDTILAILQAPTSTSSAELSR